MQLWKAVWILFEEGWEAFGGFEHGNDVIRFYIFKRSFWLLCGDWTGREELRGSGQEKGQNDEKRDSENSSERWPLLRQRGQQWRSRWMAGWRELADGLDIYNVCVPAKSLQQCSLLCDPMDWSSPGASVHSPGKNTEVGCHAHLQGIFLTQEIEPTSLLSPALVSRLFFFFFFFTTSATWEALDIYKKKKQMWLVWCQSPNEEH